MDKLHQIIQKITTDKRVLEMVEKMKPADLQKDLLSHCKEELYRIAQKYPGKIEELDSTNKLFAYFTGLIYKQQCSTTSTFYRRLRKKGTLPDPFIYQEVSRITNEEINANEPPKQLTVSQQNALALIYQRIEYSNRKKPNPLAPKKLTGNALKINRLEKKLVEIKEIRILIEAFHQYQQYTMDYILKYYRGQAKFIAKNRHNDPATVIQNLEIELQDVTLEKETLIESLSKYQQVAAARLAARLTATKKEAVAKRKLKRDKNQ